MFIGVACLLVFLLIASLMYTRRLSALLALPLMAVVIALIGGIPPADILTEVLSKGSTKLNLAYTTTMFGAVLAELINKQGIARALIRWVAEFAGDNPYILGVMLTVVTALLFSTLGGLGAVIMVGTIVLPVMLSLGIPAATTGGLYLFGISLGGMFNLANWQLYIDVLKVPAGEIIDFVLPFGGLMAIIVLTFLAIELKRAKNFTYIAVACVLIWLASLLLKAGTKSAGPGAGAAESWSLLASGIILCLLISHAVWRHLRNSSSLPGLALLTPFVPLVLVLSCRWEIIPAFVAGITYGALITWQHNSITQLTRSIIDGVASVIPAVVLMIGIGMLLTAVTHPTIANAMAPLLTSVIPTSPAPYVIGFTLMSPLALYRGPLSLWGMGSGLIALVQKTTQLAGQAVMAMLMSVGQVQGICDPTNTQNIWIATYLGVDTQALLRKTIAYAFVAVFSGLCLAVALGYVQK